MNLVYTGGWQKKKEPPPMKIVLVAIIIKLWADGSQKVVAIYSILKIVGAMVYGLLISIQVASRERKNRLFLSAIQWTTDDRNIDAYSYLKQGQTVNYIYLKLIRI